MFIFWNQLFLFHSEVLASIKDVMEALDTCASQDEKFYQIIKPFKWSTMTFKSININWTSKLGYRIAKDPKILVLVA